MTRHLLILVAGFLLGALITAVVRTRMHDPAALAAMPVAASAAMTSPAADPHAGHQMPAPANGSPVNTICAICGMPVDPALPTATYQGQTIGFGCRACPATFAKEPEKYGPAALQNRVVEE